MTDLLGTTLLVLTLLLGLATAWLSGTAPAKFAELLGLSILNSGGTNEIRSQYAGFFFAVALASAAALAGLVPRQPVFVVLLLTFGGLIAGRLVSLALNAGTAGFGPTILALYAIDTIGFLMALTALATL